MKEYKSLILNGYTTNVFLDKSLKELTDQGYQLSGLTIRGDIILFEREMPYSVYMSVEEDLEGDLQ